MSAEPWLPAQDFATRNVETQRHDPKSMLTLVKRLMHLRQEPGLAYGVYATLSTDPPLYSYTRTAGHSRYGVTLNFSGEEQDVALPAKPVLSTLLDDAHPPGQTFRLRPHEGLIWVPIP
ncbi:MAG TPA: hypothetical protein VGO93_21595 [Candidatus Xenobia bacterium]|jgi:alpha-glucosidase